MILDTWRKAGAGREFCRLKGWRNIPFGRGAVGGGGECVVGDVSMAVDMFGNKLCMCCNEQSSMDCDQEGSERNVGRRRCR